MIKIDQNRSKTIKIDQKRSKSIKIDQNRSKTIKIDQNQLKIIRFDLSICSVMVSPESRASPPKKRFTLNCELRFTTTNVSRFTLTTGSRLTMPLLFSQKHDSSFHPFVSLHGAALGAARPGLLYQTMTNTDGDFKPAGTKLSPVLVTISTRPMPNRHQSW